MCEHCLFSLQLAVLFTTVLNSTKQSPSQLESSTLVSMGYIVCGAKTTEINSFNAVEFRSVNNNRHFMMPLP